MIGRNLAELNPSWIAPRHAELDLTDRAKVTDYLNHIKPELIIHCASNDDEICLYDNLRMFLNLAESRIPMIIFSTGREIEDRPDKVGEYILSKHITQELALSKYNHITVIKLWGCFGKYEKDTRFIKDNFLRVKAGLPIIVRENKLFSYKYINNLASNIEFIMGDIKSQVIPLVDWTYSLLDYAKMIKKITGSPHDIIVEGENFYYSYVGHGEKKFISYSAEWAIEDYWRDFNTYPGA